MNESGKNSFVGYLKFLSDLSQISFFAGAQKSQPLHTTLLNVFEEHRRTMISEEKTTIAYLFSTTENQDSWKM